TATVVATAPITPGRRTTGPAAPESRGDRSVGRRAVRGTGAAGLINDCVNVVTEQRTAAQADWTLLAAPPQVSAPDRACDPLRNPATVRPTHRPPIWRGHHAEVQGAQEGSLCPDHCRCARTGEAQGADPSAVSGRHVRAHAARPAVADHQLPGW